MGRNFNLDEIPDMTGKVCIVTGGNTGIGKICVQELAKKNAHVIVASRTPSKGQAVVDEVKESTKNDKVEFMQLDLLSLSSVSAFIQSFKDKNLPLHLLLNNAGVMSCPFTLSEDGIEAQFATNHVAHYYLTTQLLPILEKSQPSRVVNVSSLAHKYIFWNGLVLDDMNDESKYNKHMAYGRSKAANILFTRELTRKLEDSGDKYKNVYVNTNHPGAVSTELTRHNESMTMSVMRRLFFIAPEDGAKTQLYLATSPEIEKKNIKGKYFVPYGDESVPNKHAASQENQTKLWDFTENLLKEKVPGYTGANI
ncbi:hypothetical protein INT43_002601 [Umbelopsis isabellina]|uniref:NAD(P)-binding protein n=1 Tax=Mortierella isabellina TaxID=91625 RepID=A0A8H7Q6H7_MORIS|nr:hypothetical protein INT43_002601 [Umbelopsis isabellina]